MSAITSVNCQSFACQSRLLDMVTEHKKFSKDFPGCPLAKTLHSQRRGPGFNPWSGKRILHDLAQPNKQIKKHF